MLTPAQRGIQTEIWEAQRLPLDRTFRGGRYTFATLFSAADSPPLVLTILKERPLFAGGEDWRLLKIIPAHFLLEWAEDDNLRDLAETFLALQTFPPDTPPPGPGFWGLDGRLYSEDCQPLPLVAPHQRS